MRMHKVMKRLGIAGFVLASTLLPVTQASASGPALIEYAVPTSASFPERIVAGPDGALWFTEGAGDKIGRVSTAGSVTEYTIPTVDASPNGITSGPDGALWFTEGGGNGAIGRITTSGSITEYPIPSLVISGPISIASGSDGALWFT